VFLVDGQLLEPDFPPSPLTKTDFPFNVVSVALSAPPDDATESKTNANGRSNTQQQEPMVGQIHSRTLISYFIFPRFRDILYHADTGVKEALIDS
jgi:hypothetical protein